MNLVKVILLLSLFTIIVLIGICYLLYKNQEALIFHPEVLPPDHDFGFPFPYEELYFETEQDAKIHAVFSPARDSAKGVILYFHGNAGSLDSWGQIAADFRELGYDVLIPDYRGYGKSKGKLSEKALFSDAEFLFQYLLNKYENKNIILYGRSLGSSMACELAARHLVKQLILESPFLSISEIAKGMFPRIIPINSLINYRLDNASKITKVQAPIHIIHGTQDDVVPYSHGKKLAELIEKPSALTTIEGGAHNNLGEYPAYHQQIKKLLQ